MIHSLHFPLWDSASIHPSLFFPTGTLSWIMGNISGAPHEVLSVTNVRNLTKFFLMFCIFFAYLLLSKCVCVYIYIDTHSCMHAYVCVGVCVCTVCFVLFLLHTYIFLSSLQKYNFIYILFIFVCNANFK